MAQDLTEASGSFIYESKMSNERSRQILARFSSFFVWLRLRQVSLLYSNWFVQLDVFNG